MASKEEILEKISNILVPGVGRSIDRMGLVRGIELENEKVKLTLASTGLSEQAPLLGKVPLESELSRLCDEGLIEQYSSEAFNSLSQSLDKVISP